MVGSRAVSALSTTAQVRRRGTALAASILAALFSVGAAIGILTERLVPAAVLVGAAGAGLLLGAVLSHGGRLLRERTLDSFVDRWFDGVVLGSIVWTQRPDASFGSAAALVAMSASFLGSYIRARGNSLDYRIEESMLTRAVRYALIVLALLFDLHPWLLWTLAAVMLLAAFVRLSQVAKEERA